MRRRCLKCGAELVDGQEFCIMCGTKPNETDYKDVESDFYQDFFNKEDIKNAKANMKNYLAVHTDEENGVAKILKTIGIAIIVVGIFSGLVLSVDAYDGALFMFLLAFIPCFVSGILFIGFSEVINLLQMNVDNQEKILKKLK